MLLSSRDLVEFFVVFAALAVPLLAIHVAMLAIAFGVKQPPLETENPDHPKQPVGRTATILQIGAFVVAILALILGVYGLHVHQDTGNAPFIFAATLAIAALVVTFWVIYLGVRAICQRERMVIAIGVLLLSLQDLVCITVLLVAGLAAAIEAGGYLQPTYYPPGRAMRVTAPPTFRPPMAPVPASPAEAPEPTQPPSVPSSGKKGAKPADADKF